MVKKHFFLLLSLAFISMAFSHGISENLCQEKPKTERKGEISWSKWEDGSQATDGKILYEVKDGKLRFYTEAGTLQRPKVKTVNEDYSFGEYIWRIYIPTMGMNERVSIGAFIYRDDTHEIDFEIGSGTAEARVRYGAKDDEVLMYLTSQGNPWHQTVIPIKHECWYDFGMTISNRGDNKYRLVWTLDGKEVDFVNLDYGAETHFAVFCSLENLKFMGDYVSTRDHVVVFDKVRFQK